MFARSTTLPPAFLVLTALVAGWAAALAPPALAGPEKRFFDDRGRIKALEQAGRDFVETEKTASANTLKKQLGRKRCRLSLPQPSRQALTAAEVFEERLAGILVVANIYKCSKCPRWHASTASGFVLTSDGAFVTSYHVVAGDKGERRSMVVMTSDGKVLPVKEVLAADKDNDTVILRIDDAERSFEPIPLSVDAPVGSEVTVVSHPNRRLYSLTRGVVSRYYLQLTKKGEPTGPGRLAITADFAKGSSGGPLLNRYGDAVGIVASTSSVYYNAQEGDPRNLQMVFKQCIPSEAILKLIEKVPQ
jgi:serine protease Do